MTDTHAISDDVFDAATIAARLPHADVADNVEVLNQLTPTEAAEVLALLPADRAVGILDKPELLFGAEIVEALPRPVAIPLLAGMSSDMAADIVQQLEDPARSELMQGLDEASRSTIAGLMEYPENTAGSMMTTEFVSVPANWSVEQTLQHIRQVERTRETVYAIYVLDPLSRRLVGAVSLRRLISGEPTANILTLAAERSPITTTPLTDREDVARLITKYDLLAVPVVDKAGHIRGIVTFDDIMDAIIEESTEDVQKFGGMEATEEPYMQIGLMDMIRKRGVWLCLLFVSEMLTASAMQYFEGELEKALVLTLFIPLIMSSGGNSGSQATSLLIRSLALHDVRLSDWWRVAVRELPTGIILGTMLGVIGIFRIVLWQKLGFYDYGEHWVLVALTVGAALIGVVTFGSVAGSMLPFALQRVGFDPASASAPFVATLVDVTGLMIYFSVALVILRGTLL
ncbi:magnesium transporter [Bradyrhizobium sp. U87765 SZCCT0131]|uniref:magnesium transporter n=1 Tax=unclassified Bradyrhizobium TaxID=2631580 RepID=UPI001BA83085|nr:MULTISPECIES: magnesium transporter [unclassified Bradyrhizobium]MBR1220833.1 magnesium transporter [Bradyrhizobium sp. U87765 SZCCT0131]MBR1260347.1 magnesium transporter [Bradyrhizobium sp. U87765 SZCCT0134]MBR1307404.1 magnesium transporter [Bradyrhizobium sp. U87765 SZCCT0110]MBR1321358.1 magnesium transporter [Bradyrhizobium sp. U87765 SZCCT0109]MBR1349671.1 magnesium transporter [Bradyrhizobium sp. U87765 SZCCT0048]